MRRVLASAICVVAIVAASACGSSGSGSAGKTTSTTDPFENASWERAGPNPSISAKMVCAPEAHEDIAASLGIKATRVTPPTWVRNDHLYSCTYVYPRGRITLTVKEMSNETETTAYYDAVQHQYGTVQDLEGLGQGGLVLKNGDVVVRKDYKVLLVDVTKIPASFVPAMRRSDVAINIAAVIMSCWTGA